jgi:hypothetical protein
MCYICISKTKTHRSNKSFIFWWLSSKVLSYESDFVDSSLPTFSLSFTRSNDFEHFCFCHRLHLLNRYCPFAGFLLSFLLYHVCQNFGIFLLLSIHEISRHSAFLDILRFAFGIFLLVLFDSFFHLNLLFESFLVK